MMVAQHHAIFGGIASYPVNTKCVPSHVSQHSVLFMCLCWTCWIPWLCLDIEGLLGLTGNTAHSPFISNCHRVPAQVFCCLWQTSLLKMSHSMMSYPAPVKVVRASYSVIMSYVSVVSMRLLAPFDSDIVLHSENNTVRTDRG